MRDVFFNGAGELLALEAQEAQEEVVVQRLTNEARHGRTPFYLRCPLDAVEDVARRQRAETEIRFLLARHVIVVGADEWPLDGDLALWRKAKAYARELNHQGLLIVDEKPGELVFERTERRT